ncbi:unnamed protein product [Cylicostephanus goldi]|uniref:Uncharacterized protein n=1 Tax=Cylicostephanus goldi TaxID=71465 RepID=A0A3P6Q5U7_CYLGO|nr:unnamed protein product [Cylicostephanus goldi]
MIIEFVDGLHFSVVGSTATQLESQPFVSRFQVFCRELQRQPDFDLLLAELCLDHVWTEPTKRDSSGEISNKMFLSRNVLSQDFVNFFISSLGQLRSIRVVHTVSNITTSGTMVILACRDATALRGGDMTAVLGHDNSISFYSGHAKCAVAVIPRFTVTQSMVLHAADSSSFVIQSGNQLTKIEIPAMFVNPLANDLFVALVEALPREKAMHLMLHWKTHSRTYDDDLELCVAEPQLHVALRFVLEQTGISIGYHPKLPWRKVKE